ncbi:MAG: hypothetical protein N2487_04695 [Verrucomicrobiae bacterium]|nr:hypothetical protein [Verrucomicrobiae bacterium]
MNQKEYTFSGRYLGGFRRTLDESRRILIPSEWRTADPAPEYILLPRPTFLPQYILVFPPQRYELVLQRLIGSPTTDTEASVLERSIAEHSIVVKPDSGGRIVIPSEFLTKLGIKKEVSLVGRIQMFEIWNPEVYEKIREQQDIEAERIIKEKGIKL